MWPGVLFSVILTGLLASIGVTHSYSSHPFLCMLHYETAWATKSNAQFNLRYYNITLLFPIHTQLPGTPSHQASTPTCPSFSLPLSWPRPDPYLSDGGSGTTCTDIRGSGGRGTSHGHPSHWVTGEQELRWKKEHCIHTDPLFKGYFKSLCLYISSIMDKSSLVSSLPGSGTWTL